MICPLTPALSRKGRGSELVAFSPLLVCMRKRKAGVGIVADGGTYKNAGFPIKDVGNDRRDPCGMTGLLPCLPLFCHSLPLFWPFPTPLLAFSRPLLAFSRASSGLFPPSSGLFPRLFWPSPPFLLAFSRPSSGLFPPSSGLFRASSGLPRPSFCHSLPLFLSFPQFLAGIQSKQSCFRVHSGVISLRQGEHARRVVSAMVSDGQ